MKYPHLLESRTLCATMLLAMAALGCGSDPGGSGGSGGDGGSGGSGGSGGTGGGEVYPDCGSVTDVDGNVYDTVVIGEQCWMQSNLRTTRYRHGEPIAQQTEQGFWADLDNRDGAWSHYDNDSANDPDWGKLYNGFAVDDGELCPPGWRVPSVDDLGLLVEAAGGSEAGRSLLANDGSWDFDTTNSTGFTALPAGGRAAHGDFQGGEGTGLPNARFWSTTHHNVGLNNYVLWLDPLSVIEGSAGRRHEGMSVRCIQGDRYPLDEGFYVGQPPVMQNDTCGGVVIGGGNWTLDWPADDYFNLDDTFRVVSCSPSAMTCNAFTVIQDDDPNAILEITLNTGVLTITSPTSFRVARTVGLDCGGPNCDALAQTNGFTFPCSTDNEYAFDRMD